MACRSLERNLLLQISALHNIRQPVKRSTSVFPMPLAPAMEVISPYRNPPCNAESSIVRQPVLAGAGLYFSASRAALSMARPVIPGAGVAIHERL